MRYHGLEIAEVGVILAIFGGGGGMLGTFLGGYLGDRMGVRDKRWYLPLRLALPSRELRIAIGNLL